MTAPAMRPETTEYAEFYQGYIDRVPESDVVAVLRAQLEDVAALLGEIGEERAGTRYEPGKWSVKEVIGHINDGERVFAYRALRISRGDGTPLAGFDQNPYVEAANFDGRTLESLIGEFISLRQANLAMIESFTSETWSRQGTASDNRITVRALVYIMAGHVRHHVAVLREKYLTD